MKRVLTFTLALLIALSCGLGLSAAASTYASKTIANSYGDLRKGTQSGQLKIDFSVTANAPASMLGVESIKLYKMNGTPVTIITGSEENGLIKKNHGFHSGTYYYNNAVSGQYYYAEVNVFAMIGNDYDDFLETTSTVRAP